MAKQKTKSKTVSLYTKNGTKVTVSESQVEKLVKAGYSKTAPKTS